MARRKSCPVSRRPFIELYSFDKNDKTTYDGTETVRRLDKFDRKWFRENCIAIISASKSFYGRTFVVPYVDIEGQRYWLVDKDRRLKKDLQKTQKYLPFS